MAIKTALVTDYILSSLSRAIDKKGRAVLALSGGSSPVPVFSELAEVDFAWDKVAITLVDERAVPVTDEASNHKLLQDHLLCGKPSAATFIPLFENPHAFSQIGSVDCALLGMGTDGHFASLFPDMIEETAAFSLEAAAAIIHTGPQGAPRHPRISMNLSMISQIDDCCLLLPNAEKTQLFANAKTNDTLPIHYLIKAFGHRLITFS